MSIQKKYMKKEFMLSCHIKDENNFLFILEQPKKFSDPFELTEFKHLFYANGSWAVQNAAKVRSFRAGYVSKPREAYILISQEGVFYELIIMKENGKKIYLLLKFWKVQE